MSHETRLTRRYVVAEGTMVLHEDAARPAVFLAGGIGITPFLAMARHAAHERLPHRGEKGFIDRAMLERYLPDLVGNLTAPV